jgi:argonaute-like protein implicated in RNA metabolism and viral defense
MNKIQLLDEKIERIRFYKALGKVIYTVFVTVILILTLTAAVNIQTMQTDTLNTLMYVQQKTDDLSNKVTNMELLLQNEEKTVSAVEKAPLSTTERELIERVCMAEAGSDISGLMAVAQVISDRSHLWNMTPLEAVTQDGQFAEPIQGEISAEAVQAVWAVFDEGMRAFDSNVTHFHSGSEEPYWTENKTFVGNCGGNYFYNSNY